MNLFNQTILYFTENYWKWLKILLIMEIESTHLPPNIGL